MEKRSNQRACMVASLVGLPLEVDKQNLKRWDFVRVKIGCRDVRKVPAVVEGLLEFYFYDFTFQREVPIEGITNTAGTKWTRNPDRHDDESPSPKKPKRGEDHKKKQNRVNLVTILLLRRTMRKKRLEMMRKKTTQNSYTWRRHPVRILWRKTCKTKLLMSPLQLSAL